MVSLGQWEQWIEKIMKAALLGPQSAPKKHWKLVFPNGQPSNEYIRGRSRPALAHDSVA